MNCTGLAASWCPIHGDCTCPNRAGIEGSPTLNDPNCPLHSPMSTHAEPPLDHPQLELS